MSGKAKKRIPKSRIKYNVSERRLFFLKQLGFRSYPHYLKSSLWASIRQQVLDRDGHQCSRCPKPATQVHHKSYGPPTLRGDRLDKLVSLCGACHKFLEFKRGHKLALDRANQRLQKWPKKTIPRHRTPKVYIWRDPPRGLLGDRHLRAIQREEF